MKVSFQFESLSDLWSMSGHGPYVWAAYGITFAGLAILIYQARLRRKHVVKRIKIMALHSADAEESR